MSRSFAFAVYEGEAYPGAITDEIAELIKASSPGRNKSFKLKIQSPEDISGEYYSAVVFDPDRPRQDLPAEFMSGQTRLIALITAKGLDYQVEIDSLRLKKEVASELTLYRFLFSVRNTGNAHCFVAGNMSLEKETTKGVYEPLGQTPNHTKPLKPGIPKPSRVRKD